MDDNREKLLQTEKIGTCTLDKVIEALQVCGRDEPAKCPYFDSWHWECCTGFTGRSPVQDDALFCLKQFRYILDNTVWVEGTENNPGYWKIPTLNRNLCEGEK